MLARLSRRIERKCVDYHRISTQFSIPDDEALLPISVVWNIPVACNRASADFMISSPLMAGAYQRLIRDYSGYRARLRAGTT
jgi:methylglyoxal synthase